MKTCNTNSKQLRLGVGVIQSPASSVFSELITSAARFVNHASAPLAPTNYLTSFPPRHLLSPGIRLIATLSGSPASTDLVQCATLYRAVLL